MLQMALCHLDLLGPRQKEKEASVANNDCVSAFLICPRGPEHEIGDVFIQIPYLRRMVNAEFGEQRPSVSELYQYLMSIRAPVFPTYRGKTPNGTFVHGFLPVLPQPGRLLLEIAHRNRTEFMERTRQALWSIAKRRVNLIGLGSLFGSNLTYGGLSLFRNNRQTPQVAYCSGVSLTSAVTCRLLGKVMSNLKIDSASARVALVGAGGVGGSAIALGISEQLGERAALVLTDNQSGRLLRLRETISSQSTCSTLIANSPSDLQQQLIDVVIVITSAEDFRLTRLNVPKGAVIIDCTTPRNTALEFLDDPERLVIDGDLLWAPRIRHFDYGTPPGTIFACHGEVIVLANMLEQNKLSVPLEGSTNNHFLGIADWHYANTLLKHALKLGLDLPPHHSFGHRVTAERIEQQISLRQSTHPR